MVRRILGFVYKEVQGLHQAAYVLAFLTLGAQLLALVRDRLLAHSFGAGFEMDAYYAAFRIPDFLFVLFSSILSVYVLIPYVSKRESVEGDSGVRQFLSQIFTVFSGAYAVVALLIAILLPYLIPYIFPGFVGSVDTLVLLVRILLVQPFLLGVSGLFGVVSQLKSRFVVYAISPILYNVGIVLGALVLYPYFGIAGLMYGVVLGAALHLAIQAPFVYANGLGPRLTSKIIWEDVRSIFFDSIPRSLTLGLWQIVLIVLIGIASMMSVGSISAMQFAYNLQAVPIALIGASYSVAAFPALAKMHAEGRRDEFSKYLLAGLRHIIFWSLPALALMIVLRAQLVRVILGTGAFDWDATRMTAAAFAIFALSLPEQAIYLLFTRALYAVSNTRYSFIISSFMLVLTISLAKILEYTWSVNGTFRSGFESLLRVEGVAGTEMLMLPLAFAIGTGVSVNLLVLTARKPLGISMRDLIPVTVHGTIAMFAAGAAAYITLGAIAVQNQSTTFVKTFIQGGIAGCAGILAAVLVYAILGSPELAQVSGALKRRIFRVRPAIAIDDNPRD